MSAVNEDATERQVHIENAILDFANYRDDTHLSSRAGSPSDRHQDLKGKMAKAVAEIERVFKCH